MHLKIKSSILIMVLTILDLCSSVPNLAIQSENAILSQISQSTATTKNNKQFLMNLNYIENSDKNSATQQNDRLMNDQSQTNDSDHPNFLLTNYMSDGEIERRIHFNGITAKETLVSNFR